MQTSFADQGIPDIPPFLFDDDHIGMSSVPPASSKAHRLGDECEAIASDTAQATRVAIKIARAISGATEVRMVAEKRAGSPDQYLLETATLRPYKVSRTALFRAGPAKKPLTEKQAINVFERHIASAYPAEVLRNGKSVAIHQILF